MRMGGNRSSLHHLGQSFTSLLGRTRSRGKCWGANRLSHRPQPSGRAAHKEGSMDWTFENNMVDSLLYCVTLTGPREGHTRFIQARAETSDTGAKAVLGKIIPGLGCRCRVWKYELFQEAGTEFLGGKGRTCPPTFGQWEVISFLIPNILWWKVM